jgi:short-subunit dehydrogenase
VPLPTPAPDRTAIVTGASSGIGREIARGLARRGHGLTLVARREDRLRELADELRAAHAVRIDIAPTDLTDQSAREGLVAAVTDRGLVPDLLVNAAGLSTLGPVHRNDPARELAMIRTDVEAVAHLCSLVLPGMVERGTGAILNVGSVSGFQPLPGQTGYSASKAFVITYGQGLRGELRGTGVTVTTLCPGPVDTEFAATAGFSVDEVMELMPRFMWVSPGDVAEAGIEGLARDRALVVPGAWTKASAVAGRFAPRSVLVPIAARMHPGLRR